MTKLMPHVPMTLLQIVQKDGGGLSAAVHPPTETRTEGHQMSLTAEQQAKRAGKLTASRVAVLMKGDPAGVLRLYREFIGEEQEENLDHVWPVQLGSWTEKLNLDWYERKNNVVLESRGEVYRHPGLEWAAATLDGWDPNLNCPVECKHVGGREPMETIIDRYQPQMQWQMDCTRATQCALSVIMGANEPIVEYVPCNEPYTKLMFERAEHFMMCVDMRMLPVEIAPIGPPIIPKTVRDMNTNNHWAHQAIEWLTTKDASDRCDDAQKALKAMVQPEDLKCFGHGVRITRDRAGRLSLRKDE